MQGMGQKDGARRKNRSDGAASRKAILEIAGRTFAERGFAAATCRQIAAGAHVPPALINYHFGGKEGLYGEALVAGHGALISIEDLKKIEDSGEPPAVQLEKMVGLLLHAAQTSPDNWATRLLIREIASPSSAFGEMLDEATFPKVEVLLRAVSAASGWPADSAEAREELMMLLLPWISLIIMPERVRRKLLPPGGLSGPFGRRLLARLMAGVSKR